MKKIVGSEVLISYPNISERFIIHADTNKIHHGRLISEKWESHCLLLTQVNPRLINYTTTEIKLLSVVETLKYKSVPFY